MAQHDYVIANGTGAAVRSDLNNALAAIVNQNSGATEPATMYAYQWWADTTTGLLKIRNAANNAWVTVGTLASANLGLLSSGSTVTAALGSASTPGITFTGDTNTGIYSPGADQVAISTSGAGRVFVDSSGRVGIGTTSPGSALEVYATSPVVTVNSAAANASSIVLQQAGTTYARFRFDGNNVDIGNLYSNGATIFNAGNAERARIDSSGRLLVGTSTARSNFYGSTFSAALQLEGTDANRRLSITGADEASIVLLARQRSGSTGGNTILNNGDTIGIVNFQGSDGSKFVEAASIRADVDATPGTNDMPTRLVFSVTRDGQASPTEAARITNQGVINTLSADSTNTLAISTTQGAGTTAQLIQGAHSASTVGGGTLSFRVYSNGNVQNTNNSYAGTSDIKLKENIVDASSQWSDIKALQVRKYNFKAETGQETHTQIGLVAQEVELVSPGLVTESPDRDAEGNDLGTVTKSVNYSVLYMKAVKALQEAMERIETLEAKVSALESV